MDEERDRIFKYSKALAECYNLALNELKTNNDFNILINKSNNIEKQIQNNKYSLNDYKSKLNIYIDIKTKNYQILKQNILEIDIVNMFYLF